MLGGHHSHFFLPQIQDEWRETWQIRERGEIKTKSFHESIPTPSFTRVKGTTAAALTVTAILILIGVTAAGFNPWLPPSKPSPTPGCVQSTTSPYILQFKVTDAIATGTVPGSLTIDIINPSNLNGPVEKITGAATNPQTTANRYVACTTYYYHAYSTGGNGYYDQYQPFTIPGTPSVGGCSNAQTCFDLTSTPWTLYQRTTAANAQAQVGVGCGTFTGRATALSTTSAGSATGVADCSPGSNVRTVNFNIVFTLSGASTCWGQPTPFLNPITAGVQNTLGINIWMAVNSTNPTVNQPWALVDRPTGANGIWRTYSTNYPALCTNPTLVPTGTTVVSVTLTFTTTVGVRLMFWFQDLQQQNVVNAGSTSAPPVNVGAFTGAGATTTIAANANSYQLSAGIPSSPILAYTISIT